MRRLPCSVALAAALLPAGAFFHADTAVASDTSLIDMNQDLALIHSPRSVPNPERTVSPFQPFKLAKVHFVVDTVNKIGFDNIGPIFPPDYAQRCKDLGFAQTAACADNQFKARLCPYDDAYYDRCCDNDYKYTKGECSYPNTISSTSCGGKYKCYCDTTLYPYTSANCPAPKELSDKCVDASGAHYAECKCPSYYKPCDASKNLVGVGEACPGVGETVYAACECESGYNQVCEQFGPTNANDYCLNGIKYYKSCKTSKDACLASGYSNSAESPCSADMKINQYCPDNSLYYNCVIDAAKYCSNKGFVLSSSANCLTGTILKCPYDGNKIFCITKQDAFSAILPDWNNKRNLSIGSTHTLTEPGWIIMTQDTYCYNYPTGFKGTVNGKTVMASMGKSGKWEDWNTTMVLADEGDKVFLNAGKLYFLPLKK